MKQRLLVLVALTLSTLAVTDLNADDAQPVLRVVFFTPSDVEPPGGVRARLKEYVDYSQMFFAKWMKHWNYECADPLTVRRDEQGYPEILFVKGRHTEASGRYAKVTFQPEVVKEACRKYGLKRKGEVWWIFTYKGPKRRGFRGGGNSRRGGTATSIYDPAREGHLRLENELASPESGGLQAKAAIHELGHALGLPRNGPRDKDMLGNSLMGPITPRYRKKFPKEEHVYLTEASAAMLWKHPLFRGSTKDRDVTPTLELNDFKVSYEKENDVALVAGKVTSDHRPHSIVIACESKATRAGYWTKCYVGRIAEDMSFQVALAEFPRPFVRLRMVCCFNNGAVIGKAGKRGLSNGFVKTYQFNDGVFTFAEGSD